MVKHTQVLVPVEAWAYASPELKAEGRFIDIGLFAEALLYYDQVLLNFASQPHLAEMFVWLANQRGWFRRHKGLTKFTSLLDEGTVQFYDYAFVSAPVFVQSTGLYDLVNIQDPIQARENTFEERYLQHDAVKGVFPSARLHRHIVQASASHAIEVKAHQFGAAIRNAKSDVLDPARSALIVQRFVDDLYFMKGVLNPPTITAVVENLEGKSTISWNVTFSDLAAMAGTQVGFHAGSPLAAAVTTTRLLWSSAQLGCDLYLPSPMSSLVADKLDESINSVLKPQVVLNNLKDVVEFPDIRKLVNAGHFSLEDVLKLRKKSKSFRRWLQLEGERDRDAIIAYHHEVARSSGLVRAARKTVSMVSATGGGAIGGAIGASFAGPVGGAVGGAVGAAVGYLGDLAARLNADWRPVVFGRWLEDRVRAARTKPPSPDAS